MGGLSKKLNKILDCVIITPLQQLLAKPSTAPQILEDLEALKHRFRDYYMASQVDWDSPFDTRICLLEQIRYGLPIPALAKVITKQDHTLFSAHITVPLTEDMKASKLERAWFPLNRRWNRFSNDVKYCLAAGVDISSQVDQLAQVCLKNGTSLLTALTRYCRLFTFIATTTPWQPSLMVLKRAGWRQIH